MITGVKRKSTAVEGAIRHFQTVDLIISHFKRKNDRTKIFELVNKESSLKDVLIATAAIHLYHSLGIRVEHSLEIEQTTVDSTKKLEFIEKKILVDEISLLLSDSFNLELDLLYRLIKRENKFISYFIEEKSFKRHKERNINDLEEEIEIELLEVVRRQYPPFFFYDMISDIIGLTESTKNEILEDSAGLKDLSIELEKKLQSEEKEDKFIEISTLRRVINKIQTDFEFKSYKELQVEEIPLRKLKRRIFEYYLNHFPISIPALKMFLEANQLKEEIIRKIETALTEKIDFENFEEKMLNFLKEKIVNRLRTHPNDFIYFLQCLNESSFTEIIYLLNKYGVYNILHIMNIDEEIAKKVKKSMTRYNIDKYDIMALKDPKNNLLELSKKAKFGSDIPAKSEQEIIAFTQKKKVIERVFLEELKLENYSQVLLLLNFEEILNKIVKEIFYYIFSKIFRPLGRIIELYLKISSNRGLFLLALKKMNDTTDSEEWVYIKLEELLIERIQNMQRELVVILNSSDQPFLINGFILARLIDTSLKESIDNIRDNPSPLFQNIVELPLKSDLLSSVSYCIAYDVIKRFETFEKQRKQEKLKILEIKEKEKEEKVKEFHEKQKISTLNWIERRITSTLIRVNNPGFNPTQLYWKDKDIKTVTDNIKIHSQLEGDITERFNQYFQFALNKIKSFAPDLKFPDNERTKTLVKKIAIKTLEQRLGNAPTSQDINNMIEGERFEISKQIAIRIGKIFDKTLYTKFKNKHRNI